jgi:hypothetical protein
MATLKTLAKRLNRMADRLDDVLNERKQVMAKAITKQLIDTTPVDTSQALSNWRVTTAGAISAYIGPHVAGHQGSTRVASAKMAMAEAERAIMSSRPLDVLVIFNSVPYIRRLNEGHSAQAPAGFVEKAILVGRIASRQHKPRLK